MVISNDYNDTTADDTDTDAGSSSRTTADDTATDEDPAEPAHNTATADNVADGVAMVKGNDYNDTTEKPTTAFNGKRWRIVPPSTQNRSRTAGNAP